MVRTTVFHGLYETLAYQTSHVILELKIHALSQVNPLEGTRRFRVTEVRLIPRECSSPISPDLCLAAYADKLTSQVDLCKDGSFRKLPGSMASVKIT